VNYERLVKLKETHPAMRLFAADHMPLIVSFFHAVFISSNRRSIPYTELEFRLDERLHELRRIYGDEVYPYRSGKCARHDDVMAIYSSA
jgi:hypothetical protein